MLVLGPLFKDRKSLETKQAQVKPNANRGWPIKPVNHIRPQLTRLCPNSSWTPTSRNGDGAPPYLGFQCYACVRPANCQAFWHALAWHQANFEAIRIFVRVLIGWLVDYQRMSFNFATVGQINHGMVHIGNTIYSNDHWRNWTALWGIGDTLHFKLND